MKKSAIQVAVIFCVTLALTAVLLIRLQSRVELGEPGVKVGAVPLYGEKSNVVATTSVVLPDMPGYRLDNPPISDMELMILPSDTVYGRKRYVARDGFDVQINTILMGKDRSSLHPPEYCITGQGWRITGREPMTIKMTKPVPYDLQLMKLSTAISFRNRDGKWEEYHGFFLYWFVADGHLTAKRGERLWLMAKELLLTGKIQRWAYVAYFSYCPPGVEKLLLERMTGFIQDSLPEFQTFPAPTTAQTKVASLEK